MATTGEPPGSGRVWRRVTASPRAALHHGLSPADLQTLLLDVSRRRAADVVPARLMRRWREDRYVRPAASGPRLIWQLQARLWALLPAEFAGIELSPVAPLGTCSAVAPVSQDRVISTVRGSEVVSDPTNVLALEAAARRKRSAKDTTVHLASCHRVLRGQPFTAAQGDKLTHDGCVNLVLNVLAGGVDTTQSQLAHAMRLFAEHPAQWELLAGDPQKHVAAAVAEVLRFEPIAPFTARIAAEDIEYRGVAFPAGTIVAVCAERANRDQPDGDTFDITAARDTRIFTFGAGAHFCLGANLARAELEEALTFLAPRMPGLTLDGEPVPGGVEGIYGVESLPLRWN